MGPRDPPDVGDAQLDVQPVAGLGRVGLHASEVSSNSAGPRTRSVDRASRAGSTWSPASPAASAKRTSRSRGLEIEASPGP